MGLWTWCADLYTGYPVNSELVLRCCFSLFSGAHLASVADVGLFSFAFGWIQIASGMAIAIWQRMQMRAAAVGKHEVSESSSASSGRLVVLPVYFYLLWVLSAADFLQGIMSLIFPLNWDSPNSCKQPVTIVRLLLSSSRKARRSSLQCWALGRLGCVPRGH